MNPVKTSVAFVPKEKEFVKTHPDEPVIIHTDTDEKMEEILNQQQTEFDHLLLQDTVMDDSWSGIGPCLGSSSEENMNQLSFPTIAKLMNDHVSPSSRNMKKAIMTQDQCRDAEFDHLRCNFF